MSLPKVSLAYELNVKARSLGIYLLVETDNHLRARPRSVTQKHMDFMLVCSTHKEELKKWLKMLAGQT